jgi:hypothetical protein
MLYLFDDRIVMFGKMKLFKSLQKRVYSENFRDNSCLELFLLIDP